MPTKIISISNQKGGVGKTTTAVSLAHALARKGRQVLLVDLDPQGQSATALGRSPASGVFYLLTMGMAPAESACDRAGEAGRASRATMSFPPFFPAAFPTFMARLQLTSFP